MDTSTLQEQINKRAEKRLDEDIQTLWKAVYSSRLILDLISDSNYPKVYRQYRNDSDAEDAPFKYKPYSIADLLNPINPAMKKIKDYHLPRYIKEETDKFLAEIETIKSRVTELDEQVGDIYGHLPG